MYNTTFLSVFIAAAYLHLTFLDSTISLRLCQSRILENFNLSIEGLNCTQVGNVGTEITV